MVAVGRARPPFADDVEHYARLLRRHARLELVEVREDAQVAGRLRPRDEVVLLDAAGAAHDSEGFARWLEARRQGGRDLAFVVGGPRGGLAVPGAERLSLGPLTLPHQLARVVLLEQLFRAHKILAGERYHY